MGKRYRIGVVSDLVGMSPEGIRLYERSGIISAKREDGTGAYRSYGFLDITALIRARTYHNYGFSTHEIEKLINTDNIDTVIDEYFSMEVKIKNQIVLKEKQLQYLVEMTELINNLPVKVNRIEKSILPAMYRLEFINRDGVVIPDGGKNVLHNWVNNAPFVFPSPGVSWEAMKQGRDESTLALGIMAEYASVVGISSNEFVRYCAPCPCLYTIVEIAGEHTKAPDYLAPLYSYTQANNIQVTGDPIARSFLSMNKKENYTRYRQIWLPIE